MDVTRALVTGPPAQVAATVRNPALPIDESGVLAERAAFR